MLDVLILSLIFTAGFCLGYAARAWRSHKRRARHMMYAPYTAGSREPARSHATTFGHPRRAF
jgi:hypothetical protein